MNKVFLLKIIETYKKMRKNVIYKYVAIITGIFTFILAEITGTLRYGKSSVKKDRKAVEDMLRKGDVYQQLLDKAKKEISKKNEFFNTKCSEKEFNDKVKKIADKYYEEQVNKELAARRQSASSDDHMCDMLELFLSNKAFAAISLMISFPMYVLMLIYTSPYVKYIFERAIMLIFVIVGVTILVFTILYVSPSDPAANILGMEATQEQIDNFNRVYNLDDSYMEQLGRTLKKLVQFDLGKTYAGNEDIKSAIGRKFPVTFQLSIFSMIVALGIAIPAGIVSAIKQYSPIDYTFMLIALIGLSIPNFWLGLVLILNFSIKMKLIPATFQMGNWITMIMPAIVLGTGMSANVARMIRSSMLEVKSQDYIVTARAKGLSEKRIIFRHILTNAMIPIVTVVGLQFGGILGGAATTEKVFNINGIGAYIVDKQFLPDTPAILAGVVYISVIISIANLIVDILYTFIDPRIKTQLKDY